MTHHHHHLDKHPPSSPPSSSRCSSSSALLSASAITFTNNSTNITAADQCSAVQVVSSRSGDCCCCCSHKCTTTHPNSTTTAATASDCAQKKKTPTTKRCYAPSLANCCRRRFFSYSFPLARCNAPRFFLPHRLRSVSTALLLLLLLLQLVPLSVVASGNANQTVPPPPPPPLCPSSVLINIAHSVLLHKSPSAKGSGHGDDDTAAPLYLIMEYWPPHGQPASPFTKVAPPTAGQSANFTIQINGTWPAVRYQFKLSAVYGTTRNGTTSTVVVQRGIAHSSPDKPVLVSVAATERACTLAWAPPPMAPLRWPEAERRRRPTTYAYYMEYFPVASSDIVFYAHTKANSVRLRRLRTGTQYRLSLYAEYFGVRSLCPLELAFRTRRRTVAGNGNRNRTTTVIPSATTTTTHNASSVANTQNAYSTPTFSVSQRNTTVLSRLLSSLPNGVVVPAKNKDRIADEHTKSTTTTTSTMTSSPTTTTTPLVARPTTSSSSSSASTTTTTITTTTPRGQDSAEEMVESGAQEEKHADEETVVENKETGRESDKSDNSDDDIAKEDQQQEDEVVDELLPKEGNNATAETLEEPSILMRPHGTRTLAIVWRVPELVPCDAFLVRHRSLGSTNARTGTQRTATPQALLPLVTNACVEVNVSCLFENTVSPQWRARRVLDLRTPAPVQSVRVIRTYTDEFFQASVLLGFALPPNVGPAHFQLYEVHVAWAPGKRVVGRQRVVFRGEHIHKTAAGDGGIGKSAEGRVNITGLEPARLYTFAVRNVSRELSSQCSAPLGVRLITPPVITSTLYAGKISTHSINVNFGESDPSHPFEQYELHFLAATPGGDAVPMRDAKFNDGTVPPTLIRRLAKNDTKSFTFNKLVPGKTYTFALFTILHGVRSRPVDVNITTYPLKVSAFHPLVGSGYVRLFWTMLNDAHNLCRFRLSYTASAGPHLHRAKSLELNGSVDTHRFSGLDWNTFYTFTITAIMGPPEAEAESESEAVTIGMANRPRSTPQLKRYGSRELLLSFENDPEAFPDRNGAIKEFAVIVAERATLEQTTTTSGGGRGGESDSTEEAEEYNNEAQDLLATLGDVWELPSWHDAREQADDAEDDGTPWIAYRTSPSGYNPFPRRASPRIAQFVIGAEDCVPGRRRLDEMYCNGALRANMDYFVRVRAFSVSGVAMETAWVGIDGAVPHAAGPGGKQSLDQKQQQLRLPCYMYLNGCYTSRERGGSGAGRTNAAAPHIAWANNSNGWLLLMMISPSAMIIMPILLLTHPFN